MLETQKKVSILPGVSVLSMLRFIEYDTWSALAEYVDNAVASYQQNELLLRALEGNHFVLEVRINIYDQEKKITIRDNAAGINEMNYTRAFKTADAPFDNTGLSEFGMGMKSASCWFCNNWKVTTKALGENVEKKVSFDMKTILAEKTEELNISYKPVNPNYHYTVIELEEVQKMPVKRNKGKVKEHLTSIYREFIRKGVLKLYFDDEELVFKDPEILNAPKWDDPKGSPVKWKRSFKFEPGGGRFVHGFVAIREKASTSDAGFVLFRRGRVVEGSCDDGFRPESIFGNSNSFRYQRVFGELHLDGFDVNFTKKGIQRDELFDVFLEKLQEALLNPEFPLLKQADNYRVRSSEADYKKVAQKALSEAIPEFEEKIPEAVQKIIDAGGSDYNDTTFPDTDKLAGKTFKTRLDETDWEISVEVTYDPSIEQLVDIMQSNRADGIRRATIRLSLIHDFMVQYVGTDGSKLELILRIAAVLGLSEILARDSGSKSQSEIRRNFNELISHISSMD